MPKVIDFVNWPNQAKEINHKANKTNCFDSSKSVGKAAKKLVEIKVETHCRALELQMGSK